jgi:hypothetical protein
LTYYFGLFGHTWADLRCILTAMRLLVDAREVVAPSLLNPYSSRQPPTPTHTPKSHANPQSPPPPPPTPHTPPPQTYTCTRAHTFSLCPFLPLSRLRALSLSLHTRKDTHTPGTAPGHTRGALNGAKSHASMRPRSACLDPKLSP